MHTILLIVHLLVALALIGLVLMQRGKGADMGAAFGSGASSTVFGARGSASFLSRSTAVLAILFFLFTGILTFSASQKKDVKSVTELVAPTAPTTTDTQPKSPSIDSSTPQKPGDVPVVPEK